MQGFVISAKSFFVCKAHHSRRQIALLTINQLRKIDEENQLSDSELLELRDALSPILEKVLDRYFEGLLDSPPSDSLHT